MQIQLVKYANNDFQTFYTQMECGCVRRVCKWDEENLLVKLKFPAGP